MFSSLHNSPFRKLAILAFLFPASEILAELPRPEFNYASGIYHDSITLTVVNSVPNSILRYSTDGSVPTENSLEWPGYLQLVDPSAEPDVFAGIPTNPSFYDDEDELQAMPIELNIRFGWRLPLEQPVEKLNLIRVRAFADGNDPGPVASGTFLIQGEDRRRSTFPVVSIAVEPEELFDSEKGIYVPGIWFHYGGGWGDDRWGFPNANYYLSGRDWELRGHWAFIEPDGELLWEGDLGIRLHGGGSRALPQKSLRLYARNEYGHNSFDAPFFGDAQGSSFRRLILRNSGQDSIDNGTMFRDGLMQSLVRHKEHLATQAFRPTIVYINGEYWGIHNLRERYDRHYLARRFGTDPDNVDYLDYLDGEPFANEGSADSYVALLDFIRGADIASAEALSHVAERMGWHHYLDYVISQLYFGNHDWPSNNVDFWRDPRGKVNDPAPLDGRWRWMLLDTDLGFALWVEPEFNHMELITEEGSIEWPNEDWATFLFRSLLKNETIRNYFIQRLASLLNTTFQEDRVQRKIDEFEQLFEPEMPSHLTRWDLLGDIADWRTNVDVLRNYATVRPDLLREHVREHFDLSGLSSLTVDVENSYGGYLSVAGKLLSVETPGITSSNHVYPFDGLWFSGIPLEVEAVAIAGYRFKRWLDDESIMDPIRTILPGEHHHIVASFTEDPTQRVPSPHPLIAQDYEFNYWSSDARAQTYPDSMLFYQTKKSDASLGEHEISKPWPLGYDLTNRTRINGLGERGVSFINTGHAQQHPDAGYLGSAILALDMRGIEAAKLSWTGETVLPNERSYALRVQYRIGDEGEFIDLTGSSGLAVEYVAHHNAGHEIKFKDIDIPAELMGQPYVQIRWVYYWIAGDSGPRAQLRLDDVSVRITGRELTAENYFNGNWEPYRAGLMLADGWWIGVEKFPWVYSVCHGWFKAVGDGHGQWLFYHFRLQWLATCPRAFPFVYSYSQQSWIHWECL